MKNHTVAAVALTAVLALAGCTSGTTDEEASPDSNSTSVPAAEFNDADVMFATMMIPHHEQAIEMSDIVLGKDDADPAVAELAQEIKDAQGPEIEQLEDWLDEWGAEPDESGGTGHGDHGDHGGMDGMLSEEDLAELEAAPGPEASTLFLEQMIEHHEGAVDMAQTQIDDGQNPDAIALAQEIVDMQNSEIEQMSQMLEER